MALHEKENVQLFRDACWSKQTSKTNLVKYTEMEHVNLLEFSTKHAMHRMFDLSKRISYLFYIRTGMVT